MSRTINVKLLVDTLATIELHPETWHQGSWRALPEDSNGNLFIVESQRCGAQLCFAGHVAAMSGGKWLLGVKDLKKMMEANLNPNDYDNALAALKPTPDEVNSEEVESVFLPHSGKSKPGIGANARARRLLGLTEEEADALFAGDNTLWELRQMVARLIMRAAEESGNRIYDARI